MRSRSSEWWLWNIDADRLHPIAARNERLRHRVKGMVPVVTTWYRVLRLWVVRVGVGW